MTQLIRAGVVPVCGGVKLFSSGLNPFDLLLGEGWTREGTREGISRDSLGSDDELSMSRAGLGSLDLELISRDGLGTREGARSSTGEGARPQTWDFHVALSSTGLVLHQY